MKVWNLGAGKSGIKEVLINESIVLAEIRFFGGRSNSIPVTGIHYEIWSAALHQDPEERSQLRNSFGARALDLIGILIKVCFAIAYAVHSLFRKFNMQLYLPVNPILQL